MDSIKDIIVDKITNIDLINLLEDSVKKVFQLEIIKEFEKEIVRVRQQDPDQCMAYYIMGLEQGLDIVKGSIENGNG